jgi:hypothetical protein
VTTPDFDRSELERFWTYWLEANRVAEREKDWRPIADWYAVDATYGWMITPDDHFMAVGREQIRDWALGVEMEGLDGWRYDYQATVMDDSNGMVVGFWRQASGIIDDATNEEFAIEGLGGSWFGIERATSGADAGRLEIAWQRDWFDIGATMHAFTGILKSGKAPQSLKDRLAFPGPYPGHYTKADLPSTVWPPRVVRGDFITQNAL